MSRGGDSREDPVDLEQVVGAGQPSVVLVFVVEVDRDELDGAWLDGPLPIIQPANATTRARGHSRPTDAATRATIVDTHQASALYGAGALARTHKTVGTQELIALELLAEIAPVGRRAGGFLVVHAAPPRSDDTVDDLQHFLWSCLRGDSGKAFRDDLRSVLGPGVAIDGGMPARHLSFIAVHDNWMSWRDEDPILVAYAVLAGDLATPWRDNGNRAAAHMLTIAKPDWSALILRDGGAYVSHPGSDGEYGPTLRMLVHSIHTDALLLALVQRMMIDRSGALSVTASLEEPDELVALERHHFEFRRTLWRTALTKKRTAPPDVVLHKFQEELLTLADVVDVEDRVSDGARLAATLTARKQQKALEAQAGALKAQEEAQSALNRTVQNATVVIGSFALAFTAAPVVSEPSWAAFWVAAVAGLLSMAAAFGVLTATGRRHAQVAKDEREAQK